jgi:hypothetical protein
MWHRSIEKFIGPTTSYVRATAAGEGRATLSDAQENGRMRRYIAVGACRHRVRDNTGVVPECAIARH